MTTGRINQHRLVQTLGQLVIQKCHDLWTWSSCPFGHLDVVLGTWSIWTWSSPFRSSDPWDVAFGHHVFGHHVFRTWSLDTVSLDIILGHFPSIPLPLDTYLAVRRLFGLGHYLTKSPVTKPVPYHVICNNAHAMAWSDSHIKWGPFQTQLTNHVTMFGLPRLRKRYPLYHSQVDIVTVPSTTTPSIPNATHQPCYHVWLARLWKQYPIVSFPSGHLSSNDNTPLSQSLVQHINPNIVFRIPFSP
ncbi:hypothetical protein BATDEDRAFT_28519 [Batrachochytrium dendrobatidis JAM81]|uniref:Uncharacterized protein n=1 Tax=Batrachochytrium dendrobatidis (strain JAM81 / FGSC 10211) TaxID=684364 RepID=F4PEA8_BATDJ|nr:hypothetical protein BATDEDRAFT_28519 [Batrachochytrium dendrobatidis JAM81]|eukprot:XP_006682947.1 hypothetical protein BATDEDRAFT_28519 [Batrachochytrium dendrobatidis JAM81]